MLGCGPRTGRKEGEELPEFSLQSTVQAEEVWRYVVATDAVQRRADQGTQRSVTWGHQTANHEDKEDSRYNAKTRGTRDDGEGMR